MDTGDVAALVGRASVHDLRVVGADGDEVVQECQVIGVRMVGVEPGIRRNGAS